MQRWKKPLVIGIAGCSGSGKSTFAGLLADRLKEYRVRVVSTDAFFKRPLPSMISPVTGQEMADYNSPESIDSEALVRTVGELAESPDYDVVVGEGISMLYFSELRDLLDLKVFVDLDADERLYRRIRRNMQWGLQLEDIAGYFLKSAKFMENRNYLPTKTYADIIVNGYRLDGAAADMVVCWVKNMLEG